MDLLSEHPFGAGGLHARMYRLQNGLQVLLLRDPAAPIFAYQTWFRVGSRDEREGKTGIAHLFEHLMFNETESLKQGEFDRKLEERGGHSNAATWVDWTYYQDDLPSTDLELCVRLEADRMAHLVVRSGQVESAREVVMNERRIPHPGYGQETSRTKKLYAHDEQNEAKVGEVVRISEARPLSRLKRWRLVEIVTRAAK